MPFPSPAALGRILVFAGAAVAFTACGGGSGSTSSTVYPAPGAFPTTYQFLQMVSGYPAPKGTFSFDIGFVDESAFQYYLADKATNGIDVVDTVASKYLGTAGGGSFQGNGTIPAGFPRSPNGGPNGDVPLGNGLVAAGDGNSTLKIVNVATISSTPVATIQVPNPYTGPALGPGICEPQPPAPGAPDLGTPTSLANNNNNRVDEMAYDPTDNVIAAVSDNACPVFITFFSGSSPYTILGQVALTTANGGGEQTVWDPTQGLFLTAIPSTTGHPNGAIDVFSPKAPFVLKSENGLPVNCGPSGLALGKNETIVAACGNTTSMTTFNAVTFAQLNNAPGPSPDEVWYSPVSNRFYGADTGGATLAVLDGSGNMIARVATAAGSHSVAVESRSDHVFIPQNAGPNIGIAIYDH